MALCDLTFCLILYLYDWLKAMQCNVKLNILENLQHALAVYVFTAVYLMFLVKFLITSSHRVYEYHLNFLMMFLKNWPISFVFFLLHLFCL